jgi:negative regulator of flagellin synthesis FlgM
MSSIDRISSDAARTYVQQSDAARTAAASSANAQHAGKAHHAHSQASKTDSVTLSDGARSLANARAAVEKAPDVRQQKVADIKQQVDSGTYQVSARVLARKMLDASNNPT